jgi:hypothetical protein
MLVSFPLFETIHDHYRRGGSGLNGGGAHSLNSSGRSRLPEY